MEILDETTPLRRSFDRISWLRRARAQMQTKKPLLLALLMATSCGVLLVSSLRMAGTLYGATPVDATLSEAEPAISSSSRPISEPSMAFMSANEQEPDVVHFVPEFGAPLERQFAGELLVDEKAMGNLFYWFLETSDSSRNTENTPIMVWLNGGPGISSMTGMLAENGPYRITNEGKLIPNPFSWTKVGHMLFIDQPVGTGYATVRDDEGYVATQDQMASELYRALQLFFQKHPKYKRNPVYMCGEAYAGKYVPYIAHYIHDKNSKQESDGINLQGMAIGNGLMWPVLQTRSIPDYAIALGLIDSQQYEGANVDISSCEEFHRQGRHVDAFRVCRAVENGIYERAGNPSLYDIRKSSNELDEISNLLSRYFNSDVVRSALNVPPGTPWRSVPGADYGVSDSAPPIARHLMGDEMLDVPMDIFRDLLDNYQVLFYAGNMDGSSTNNLGIGRMIDRLAWKSAIDYRTAPRRPWRVGGQVAGLVKTIGNMSFVVVTNAGHFVARDQPQASLDMMRRFLTNESFFG